MHLTPRETFWYDRTLESTKPGQRSQAFSRRIASMISRSGPAKDSLIAGGPLYPSIPDIAAQVGEVFCALILLKKSVNVAAAVSLRGIKLSAWRLLSRYRWSLMVFKSGSAPFVLSDRLRYAIWRRQAD